MTAFDDFKWRDLVYHATESVEETLSKEKVVCYAGFDPTAVSLHVGSMVPLIQLARFQKHGHTPIALAGGGTGLIGDPSGKASERTLLSEKTVEDYIEGIKPQLEHFLDFKVKSNPAKLLNNAEWLCKVSMMEFLRDVGKNFTVNVMLQKESVNRRIESESGISYTEFSYMLMQAYDFLQLHDREKCNFQIGGSDQWGNITAGTDLIRKKRSAKAHGLVFPLLLDSAGNKFGKTEAGAVWLDKNLTSPYKFYQFWLNTEDRDVIRNLKFFTDLDENQILDLQKSLATAPEKREAQISLARTMTILVHGETELQKSERASSVLFGGDMSGLSVNDVMDIFSDVPTATLSKELLNNTPAVDFIVASGIVPSKGEAKRMIQAGGIYINNRRISDVNDPINLSYSIDGQLVVIRKGKKEYLLVKVS